MKIKVISLFIGLVLSTSLAAQSKSGIEGAWRLTEVTKSGPNAASIKSPQPSLYIFTKKHYSIMYVSSESPRAEIEDITKLTAEDLRKVFVESFVANSGTYEVAGGKLTVHPMVAKSPGYMKAGTASVSSFKIEGNTMTLVTDPASNPGTTPTTFKLMRVE